MLRKKHKSKISVHGADPQFKMPRSSTAGVGEQAKGFLEGIRQKAWTWRSTKGASFREQAGLPPPNQIIPPPAEVSLKRRTSSLQVNDY